MYRWKSWLSTAHPPVEGAPMMLQAFRLEGRRAVVTGGSGAIGSALTAALYEAGADVAIVGRSDSVHEAAASFGVPDHPVHGVRCDLTDRAALPAGFAEAVEKLGGIDILVACHGM